MKPGRIRGTQTSLRSVCEGLASILLGPETQESGRNDGSAERAYCVARHTCGTGSLFSDGDWQLLPGPWAGFGSEVEWLAGTAAAARLDQHVMSYAGASTIGVIRGRWNPASVFKNGSPHIPTGSAHLRRLDGRPLLWPSADTGLRIDRPRLTLARRAATPCSP
jgi:hypothetical protein